MSIKDELMLGKKFKSLVEDAYASNFVKIKVLKDMKVGDTEVKKDEVIDVHPDKIKSLDSKDYTKVVESTQVTEDYFSNEVVPFLMSYIDKGEDISTLEKVLSILSKEERTYMEKFLRDEMTDESYKEFYNDILKKSKDGEDKMKIKEGNLDLYNKYLKGSKITGEPVVDDPYSKTLKGSENPGKDKSIKVIESFTMDSYLKSGKKMSEYLLDQILK